MDEDLIAERERALDELDSLLDRYPRQDAPEYLQGVAALARRLEEIQARVVTAEADAVEAARTARAVGDAHAAWAGQLNDHQHLETAVSYYLAAEQLLDDRDVPVQQGRIHFNLANALCRLGDDTDLLTEARRHYEAALAAFEQNAPQHLPAVRQALASLESTQKLAEARRALDASVVLPPGHQTAERMAEWLRQARTIVQGAIQVAEEAQATLPANTRDDPRLGRLIKITQGIATLLQTSSLQGSPPEQLGEDVQMALLQRLREETVKPGADMGKLIRMLEQLRDFLKRQRDGSGTIEQDVVDIEARRDLMRAFVENTRYLSHGLPRPPEGSRAASLVNGLWPVREYLTMELALGCGGEEERSGCRRLLLRATHLDQRLHECGGDTSGASEVERHELRPFLLEARRFSLRRHLTLATPYWHGRPTRVSPETVFYSGGEKVRESLASVAAWRHLILTATPLGDDYANLRWQQIHSSTVGVFDFTSPPGRDLAAVAYDLGIARTLGKPALIIRDAARALPFDIDLDALTLGEAGDPDRLGGAIDRMLFALQPTGHESGVASAIDAARKLFGHIDSNEVRQVLGAASNHGVADPIIASSLLRRLCERQPAGALAVTPAWPGVSQSDGGKRLFHVMPFRPDWAPAVTQVVQNLCDRAGATYVRGDQPADPRIIRSIWNELCCASHVLVDLTDFNANVAFELGIAHTLGRPTLIVGSQTTVDALFPSLAKERVTPVSYSNADPLTLIQAVSRFLS